MTSEEKGEGRRTRPFADFLAEHNNGHGHAKSSELLQELVSAVVDTGKKGTMTITVSIEPMKNAENGTLLTQVTATAKIPTLPVKAAIFYADEDNNLVRQDPRQLTFDSLKEVAAKDPAELKDAPAPVLRDAAAGGAQ